MSEYRMGPSSTTLSFEYEDMIESNNIDVSKYSWDDVHIPVDFLPEDKQNEEYIDALYERCIKEKKPWQEYESVVCPYSEDEIY